jgi:hypothetical protein
MIIELLLLTGGLGVCTLIGQWMVRPMRATDPYWI